VRLLNQPMEERQRNEAVRFLWINAPTECLTETETDELRTRGSSHCVHVYPSAITRQRAVESRVMTYAPQEYGERYALAVRDMRGRHAISWRMQGAPTRRCRRRQEGFDARCDAPEARRMERAIRRYAARA